MPEEGIPGGVLRETLDERRMRQFKYVFVVSAFVFLVPAFWLSASYTRPFELWGAAVAYVVPLAATAYAIHVRKLALWRAMPLVWAGGLLLMVVSHWTWPLHPTHWPRHVLMYSISVALAYWWWRRRRAFFVR